MDTSSYVPLSLATAMRRELDVSANNIANANTTGFKSERMLFDSYLEASGGGSGMDDTAYVIDRGSFLDDRPGAMVQTGNPLDLALQGAGWFSYRGADGRQSFGRDGSFSIDAQGNLVTQSGAQVLDPAGGAIAIPPDAAGGVQISRDGTITDAQGGVMGQVGVFDLPDLQAYTRIGAGQFIAPDGGAAPLPARDTEMVQGALEQSNVEPVVEMTRMMDIQRAYERAVKLMDGEDDLRRDMLRRLGRIT
ncbi:flagellar basal-body rod protein FlgF [Mesobaculum littorinae]|uniref:Flagellar basal-body rod protein FlgF n=1 Tax=Mesobaculum littorinae TaxID=2486419 RepID=A0A438ADU7_9RHOB|nr:flagellar basal-body rod protein FlgF [Mesobaculum littorinae]RVV96861.1 flagellar basal-body rod protein FlgF [Mesobaculum littorinae]